MMKISISWSTLSVIAALVVLAACTKQEAPAPQEPAPVSQSMVDSTIAVTIASDGTFSQTNIAPNPGNTVAFTAEGADVVLCVDPGTVFGDERFPIANGETLELSVQPEAEHVDFAFVACVGDLEVECGGCRGVEGGGRTGP